MIREPVPWVWQVSAYFRHITTFIFSCSMTIQHHQGAQLRPLHFPQLESISLDHLISRVLFMEQFFSCRNGLAWYCTERFKVNHWSSGTSNKAKQRSLFSRTQVIAEGGNSTNRSCIPRTQVGHCPPPAQLWGHAQGRATPGQAHDYFLGS